MFYGGLCDETISCLSYGEASFSTGTIEPGSIDVSIRDGQLKDRQIKEMFCGYFKVPVMFKTLQCFCKDIARNTNLFLRLQELPETEPGGA